MNAQNTQSGTSTIRTLRIIPQVMATDFTVLGLVPDGEDSPMVNFVWVQAVDPKAEKILDLILKFAAADGFVVHDGGPHPDEDDLQPGQPVGLPCPPSGGLPAYAQIDQQHGQLAACAA